MVHNVHYLSQEEGWRHREEILGPKQDWNYTGETANSGAPYLPSKFFGGSVLLVLFRAMHFSFGVVPLHVHCSPWQSAYGSCSSNILRSPGQFRFHFHHIKQRPLKDSIHTLSCLTQQLSLTTKEDSTIPGVSFWTLNPEPCGQPCQVWLIIWVDPRLLCLQKLSLIVSFKE